MQASPSFTSFTSFVTCTKGTMSATKTTNIATQSTFSPIIRLHVCDKDNKQCNTIYILSNHPAPCLRQRQQTMQHNLHSLQSSGSMSATKTTNNATQSTFSPIIRLHVCDKDNKHCNTIYILSNHPAPCLRQRQQTLQHNLHSLQSSGSMSATKTTNHATQSTFSPIIRLHVCDKDNKQCNTIYILSNHPSRYLYYNSPYIWIYILYVCRCSHSTSCSSCSIVSGDVSDCLYRLSFLSHVFASQFGLANVRQKTGKLYIVTVSNRRNINQTHEQQL